MWLEIISKGYYKKFEVTLGQRNIWEVQKFELESCLLNFFA